MLVIAVIYYLVYTCTDIMHINFASDREFCRYQKAKQRLEVKKTVNVLNALNMMSAGGGPATKPQPAHTTNTKPDTKDPPV